MNIDLTNNGLVFDNNIYNNLTKGNISSFSHDDYYEFLISLIPTLKTITNVKAGWEGKVFFVDKNFVVKKYSSGYLQYMKSKIYEYSPFEIYFHQMQDFWERGFSVNKFYTYAIIQDGDNAGLYVLQERVKGKSLFEESCLSEMFGKLPFECTKEEFNFALRHKNNELYYAIVEAYLKSIYDTNIELYNLPEEVIARFIQSDFDMRNEARHAVPDVQASNVILGDNNLTHIDPYLLYTEAEKCNKEMIDNNKVKLMRDITTMFKDNFKAYLMIYLNNGFGPINNKIKKFEKENKAITAKAIGKYFDITNQLYAPKFACDSESNFKECSNNISPIVDSEDKKILLDKLEREF